VENKEKDKTEMRIFVVKGFSGRVEVPNMLSWSARAIVRGPRNFLGAKFQNRLRSTPFQKFLYQWFQLQSNEIFIYA